MILREGSPGAPFARVMAVLAVLRPGQMAAFAFGGVPYQVRADMREGERRLQVFWVDPVTGPELCGDYGTARAAALRVIPADQEPERGDST